MANNTYDVYDINTGQTTTYNYDPLPENTFNWSDWGGNPADYGGSTSGYSPTNTTIGMDYSSAGGQTNTSGGMGTYETNFGFTSTNPPKATADVVAEAKKSGWDLSGLASQALDWLLTGNNWQKVLAAAGGLAGFLEANGAKKPTASQAAADQYKAMYDLLHKPVKVNGQMVDLYGPIEGIKPLDRMRQDASGQFIPPELPKVTGGITAAHGGLVHNYAQGGLVKKFAIGGSANTILNQGNDASIANRIANQPTSAARSRVANTSASASTGTSTGAGTTSTGAGASTTGALEATSGTSGTGTTQASNEITWNLGKNLTTEQKQENLNNFLTNVTAGMTNAQISALAKSYGLSDKVLPKNWTTTARNARNDANMNAALAAVTGTSDDQTITDLLAQYGKNLPKNAGTRLREDLVTERTNFTTNYTQSENNANEVLGKLTAGMTTDQVNALIASYNGMLPSDIQDRINSALDDINKQDEVLKQYGDTPSQFTNVTDIYKTYLNREPTAEEKYYWGAKLLSDGVIDVREVSDFIRASTNENEYTAGQAALSSVKTSYTAGEIENAFSNFVLNPANVTAADMAIIDAVGGVSNANMIANGLYNGTFRNDTAIQTGRTLGAGTTLMTDPVTGLVGYKDSSGKFIAAPNMSAAATLTPADASALLAKEAAGIAIPPETWAQYGGRDRVMAVAQNYTGYHPDTLTTVQMETYNPTNIAVHVKRNEDGTYTTTYLDGSTAFGKPSRWLGAVEGETAPAGTGGGGGGGTSGETVAQNVTRSQNLFTGNFANYGQPGGGGEWQWFNISNPLQTVAGGLYPASVTGAAQPRDVWTGVTPATTTASPTPSTTNLASNILSGTTYVPPSTATMAASATPWNAAPATVNPVAPAVVYPGYANGGPVWSKAQYMVPGTSTYARGGRPRMNGAINGDGHGQEDLIPAQLSDGEYVFDADAVAALGNGSTKAGAAILDKMREEIRRDNRSAPVTDIPRAAKSPLEYLAMASKKVKKGRK